MLFILCYPFRKNSSQVAVLWEDHRNDLWINTFGMSVILSVAFLVWSFLGILMSTGGSKLRWCRYYFVPIWCIIHLLQTSILWVLSSQVNPSFEGLVTDKRTDRSWYHRSLDAVYLPPIRISGWKVGAARVPTAPHIQVHDLQRRHCATWHRPGVSCMSTCNSPHLSWAYISTQSGPDYFVEIDIVMDGSTPLYKAHDVSQQLQDRIEALPTVERAFVHVDYETTHSPVCPFFFLNETRLTKSSRNIENPLKRWSSELQ